MGVFSSVSESSALQVDAIEVQCDNFHEGALALIAESEENYSAIIKAVGEQELAVYESTGEYMVYTEGAIGSFLDKVKEFLMSIWKKIKGLFNHFIALLDSFTKSDKEFVNKYKKDLFNITHSLSDFKYKGYVFKQKTDMSIDKVSNRIGGYKDLPTVDQVTAREVEVLRKINEDYSEYEDELRGLAVGESGGLTGSEFTKSLFEVFRNGESEKEELENPNLSDIVSQLEGAEKQRREAKKAYDALEKEIKKAIKEAETAKNKLIRTGLPKDADKPRDGKEGSATNSDVVFGVNVAVRILRTRMALLQTVNGALLTSLKDESRQNKGVCVSLLHYKPKKEDAEMGGSWQHNVNENFLANVKLK